MTAYVLDPNEDHNAPKMLGQIVLLLLFGMWCTASISGAGSIVTEALFAFVLAGLCAVCGFVVYAFGLEMFKHPNEQPFMKKMIEKMDTFYKYIFKGEKDYLPFMKIENLENNFSINGTNIETFKHNHGSIDVQTYKFGKFAYSTDLKKFYDEDIDKLKNLDLWIVGLLREDPHPAHAGFEQVMEFINYIKPKKTVFTHMTALLDEKQLKDKCPPNVVPGYDGMTINI